MPTKRKPRTWTRWALSYPEPSWLFVFGADVTTRDEAEARCGLHTTPIKVTITEVLPKPRKPRAKR